MGIFMTGTDRPLLDNAAPPPRASLGVSSFQSDCSMESLVSEGRPKCRSIVFAFTIWAAWTLLVSLTFFTAWILQQILVLPFRCCGGRPLLFALRLTGPIISSLTCLFVTTNTCEPCYGANLQQIDSFDDFLSRLSAMRRKNIRRNVKSAENEFERQGIQVTFHKSGEWRITRELLDVLWEQCERHEARAHSWSDIISCGQPVSPRIMYFGEIVLLLAFASDMQIFRNRDGQMVSFNTQVRIGCSYWNPNYATVHEYSRVGIYNWFNRYQLKEAIRLRVGILNVMPSMRSAKGALGLRPLHRCRLMRSVWSCRHRSPSHTPQELKEESAAPTAPQQPQGGKRAARKKAAAAAAVAAAGNGSEMTPSPENTAVSSHLSGLFPQLLPGDVKINVKPEVSGTPKAAAAKADGKRAARKKAAAAKAEAAKDEADKIEAGAKPTSSFDVEKRKPDAMDTSLQPSERSDGKNGYAFPLDEEV